MGPFKWGKGIDTSSYAKTQFKIFSPFSYEKTYYIPVPGQEYLRARSVEGIWQGLKVINGSCDYSLLERKPKKRRGKPEGHAFGNQLLDYVSARKEIYVPAYTYHVIHNALPKCSKQLEELAEEGTVYFCDVENNPNIENTKSPLAHSAVLVNILNAIFESPIPPFNKTQFQYLQEQVESAVEYREKLDDNLKQYFDEVITFAYLFSLSELEQTFALRFIKEADIQGDRLLRYLPTDATREPYENCFKR
ncbi:hypothetical protein D6825_02230 [Candidatus Woesearchaeota archaeon]|nr:MAG: hypothetical protein D6825_02230 [Candidatus Woesearchaeota archaeon]